jgi:hypothetical protein
MSWLDLPARCSVFSRCITWGELLLYSVVALGVCLVILYVMDRYK